MMFDNHNNRIVAGNYLRDVRFGKSLYLLVTNVVPNTRVEGFSTHTTSDGKWAAVYGRKIENTSTDFEVVSPASLPGEARDRLLDRARYERDAQRRETPAGWREIERDTAWGIWSSAGYDRWTFVLTENESYERTFANPSGYTHAKTAPNDHYWRIVVVAGRWYFAITD